VSEHIRPRYWYVVLAACGSSVSARWETDWTNHGGWWQREFSHDDQSLLEIYMICAAISTATFVMYMIDRQASAKHVRRLHPMTWWIAAAAGFFSLNQVLHAIHLYAYADDGWGYPWLKVVGRWMGVCFQTGLSVILVAIAKGWTVSSDTLKQDSRFKVMGLGLFLGYGAVWQWHSHLQDPASTRYMYDSLPGMVIVCLRLVAAAWFILELWQTLQYYHPAAPGRETYFKLGGVYGVWFLTFPFYVALAALIAAHTRDKVVIGLVVVTDTVALVVIALWFRPAWVDEHFDSSGQVQGRYSAVLPGFSEIEIDEATALTNDMM